MSKAAGDLQRTFLTGLFIAVPLDTITYSLTGKQNKHIVATTVEYLMAVKKNKLLIHTGCAKSQIITLNKNADKMSTYSLTLLI